MNTNVHQNFLSPNSASTLPCCWKLGGGQALTLRPSQRGLLRMTEGQVWLTFDNAQQDDGVRGGDYFLKAGEGIELLPGQVLVMEAWNASSNAATYFSWEPLPAAVGHASGLLACMGAWAGALRLAASQLSRSSVGIRARNCVMACSGLASSIQASRSTSSTVA